MFRNHLHTDGENIISFIQTLEYLGPTMLQLRGIANLGRVPWGKFLSVGSVETCLPWFRVVMLWAHRWRP